MLQRHIRSKNKGEKNNIIYIKGIFWLKNDKVQKCDLLQIVSKHVLNAYSGQKN
jgi:predicted thioredoxin/glutaredoxin